MLWIKDKNEKKISQLHNLLLNSFGNVRADTNTIFQWLNYLYKKNIDQEKLIIQLQKSVQLSAQKSLDQEHLTKQLQLELSHIPQSEDIKRIIEEYYPFHPIMKRIEELDAKIELLKSQKTLFSEPQKEPYEVGEIKARLEKLEQKKTAIKEKIIKRITKNSKDYVKTIIFSYIKKYEKISALQLKEMVVEEQGLCSKSSFYRILDEIEGMDEIAAVRKGKEKHYMARKMKLQ